MSPTICFTSLNCAYLPRARMLAASVRRHQPNWYLWAVLVDPPPPHLDLRTAFFGFDRVVDARALVAGSFERWRSGHDVISACCAVKGAMLLRLLDTGAARVVYLDPDVALFAPLDPLGTAPVSLTPHRLSVEATTPAARAAAADTLRHGVFNLGFLAVTGSEQGYAFARWWVERLKVCVDDPANGLFLDQRYCDEVPTLFPGCEIVTDPGYNVASWNLDQRALTIARDGRILVNDVPLRFMHFSKHGGVGERALRHHAATNPVAMELWAWYGRALATEDATPTRPI